MLLCNSIACVVVQAPSAFRWGVGQKTQSNGAVTAAGLLKLADKCISQKFVSGYFCAIPREMSAFST